MLWPVAGQAGNIYKYQEVYNLLFLKKKKQTREIDIKKGVAFCSLINDPAAAGDGHAMNISTHEDGTCIVYGCRAAKFTSQKKLRAFHVFLNKFDEKKNSKKIESYYSIIQ
jgi:hypothetical protein